MVAQLGASITRALKDLEKQHVAFISLLAATSQLLKTVKQCLCLIQVTGSFAFGQNIPQRRKNRV